MPGDDRLRALLLAEGERARGRAAKLERDLAALTSDRRGESDDDEHDPEGVTLSSQWSMLAGLLESAREEVRQVDDALARLAAGEYGVCASCGEPIPAGQLEARPFREQCVRCADAAARR